MPWLLDTNVLSELRKPRPEQRVVDFVAAVPLRELYVSIVSLAEIRYGIESNADPQKQAALRQWLTFKVRPMFRGGRTLSVTEEVLLRWRLMMEEGRKSGHTFSQPDLLIAATAAHHGLTIVTRDRSDFDMAHVPVVNPWEAP
jgi:toxin FitB